MSVKNKNAHAAETLMYMICATWITLRQSNRSGERAEINGKQQKGVQWLSTAKPASTGEWNF